MHHSPPIQTSRQISLLSSAPSSDDSFLQAILLLFAPFNISVPEFYRSYLHQAERRNKMDQVSDRFSLTSVDRWEELKPVIKRLYLEERKKLVDVVTEMKYTYRFDAV